MMMKKQLSFRRKIVIPTMIIFVASILIVAVINIKQLDDLIIKKTNGSLDIFTGSILSAINHLDIILNSTKQMLNEKDIAIAKSVAHILDDHSVNMSPEALKRLADPLNVLELNIVNSDGILVHSNISDYIGFDYKKNERTNIYMGLTNGTLTELSEEPHPSILSGSADGQMNHYTGVTRAGGGFVHLGFPASILSKLQEEINVEVTIRETRPGDNGYGFILSNGLVRAHPDPAMKGRDVSGEDWYQSINSGSGYAWINIDARKYYAGYINENGNTVAGLIPETDFYRVRNLSLIETAIFLAVAVIIMLTAIYITISRLVAPISSLVQGIGKIAKGNLEIKIEGSYNDEYDKIKDAINTMVTDIKAHMDVISGIEYASKIQTNMLPLKSAMAEAFSDYSVIWKPRDVVGGDIYWMKRYDRGTVLTLCDCTGHGTPGALLTMLVVSILESFVNEANCDDTAAIIWELEKKFVSVFRVKEDDRESNASDLKDGCDIAVLFIANDGSVNVSAGNTNVFICDGKDTRRIKGQKIFIGEGSLAGKDDIETTHIPADSGSKFYIASDGLFDQPGGEKGYPFGYKRFEKIILDNHNEKLSAVSGKIWETFEFYRNAESRVDDFALIMFKP